MGVFCSRKNEKPRNKGAGRTRGEGTKSGEKKRKKKKFPKVEGHAALRLEHQGEKERERRAATASTRHGGGGVGQSGLRGGKEVFHFAGIIFPHSKKSHPSQRCTATSHSERWGGRGGATKVLYRERKCTEREISVLGLLITKKGSL